MIRARVVCDCYYTYEVEAEDMEALDDIISDLEGDPESYDYLDEVCNCEIEEYEEEE